MGWRDAITKAVLAGKPGGPHPGGIHVYHSSPHDFDKFDWNKLRTGEGANVYGSGFYFAENPAVSGRGGQYWDQFLNKFPETELAAAERLKAAGFDREKALAETQKRLNDLYEWGDSRQGFLASDKVGRQMHERKISELDKRMELLRSGAPVGPRTYEVNIAARPELMLDWDKPLKQQPVAETVRGLVPRDLRGAFDANVESGISGANAYHNYIPGERYSIRETRTAPYAASNAKTAEEALLAAGNDPGRLLRIRDPAYVSETLAEAGIPGIRYLDAGSRMHDPIANAMIDRFGSRSVALEEALRRQKTYPPGDLNKWDRTVNALSTPESYNYVVTDPSKLDILAKYGIVGTAGGGMAALAAQDQYQR